MGTHTERIVVLVDMDCFYCQVEEKLDPTLVGKPIAVAQYNAWKGGGLIAVNYPAREKGVTRHMRGDEAKEICPDIMLVRVPQVRGKADLTKYREGGKRVAEVLQTFTPLLQRASIDEAYLDITEAVENRLKTIGRQVTKQDVSNTYVVAWDSIEAYIDNVYQNDYNNEHNLRLLIGGVIVEEIRAAVYEKTGYRCSAGVAHNKILAKLACGINKPNKQTLLPHESVEEMYKTLPIKKIKGLGAKFGNTLAEDLKIKYMSELAQFSERDLLKRYDDKTANFLYNIARGINLEPVEVRLVSKSIGCCKRFPGKTALLSTEDVTHWLSELAEELSERLEQDIQENNRKAKQIVLSFAQEVNRKDIHSSRTITLNSYEAKKITEDTFETLKRYTQKPDGSFVIKFLGLSAGKFENTKNVNEITSFFKNVIKNENGPNESQKVIESKKPNNLTVLFKNMNKNHRDTSENQKGSSGTKNQTLFNENISQNENVILENANGFKESKVSDSGLNIPKNIASFLENMAKNNKTDFGSSENGIETKENQNDSQVAIFESEVIENPPNEAENKNRNILSYFDKAVDPSQNFNSTRAPKNQKTKQKSFFMKFFNEKNSSSELGNQKEDSYQKGSLNKNEGPHNDDTPKSFLGYPQTNSMYPNDRNHSSTQKEVVRRNEEILLHNKEVAQKLISSPRNSISPKVLNKKYQNIFGKENYLNLSNMDDELNLDDIENDAQNVSDEEVSEILLNQSTFHEDSFSNSTIEGDYDELLAVKEEFPFKSSPNIEKTENYHTSSIFNTKNIKNTNQSRQNSQALQNETLSSIPTAPQSSWVSQKIETSEKNSPIFGKSSTTTGNSFFMRYLKKMENKTEVKSVEPVDSSRSSTGFENYDTSSSDSCQSYNSVKNDSFKSNKSNLNEGYEPTGNSSKDDNLSENCEADRSLRNDSLRMVRFDDPGCSKYGNDDIDSSTDSCKGDNVKEEFGTVVFEPIAGSSKEPNQGYNFDEISMDNCQTDMAPERDEILPVETVYSQNSDASTLDESMEICPECEKSVAKRLLISHMDHHLALKLMDEEKKLFKQEFELAKQRRMNKSPTVPELIKFRLKNKSVKRKQQQPENNTKINAFFVQKTESSNVEITEVCSECGKSVKSSELSSHLDFHAAKKLHLELNPVKVVAKNQFRVTSNKKCNNKNIVKNSNCTLTNFFKPK